MEGAGYKRLINIFHPNPNDGGIKSLRSPTIWQKFNSIDSVNTLVQFSVVTTSTCMYLPSVPSGSETPLSLLGRRQETAVVPAYHCYSSELLSPLTVSSDDC